MPTIDTKPLTPEQLRERSTITVPEAGAVLGLHRQSAYDAARRGDIPTLKIGRRLMVPVPALLRMLETADVPARP